MSRLNLSLVATLSYFSSQYDSAQDYEPINDVQIVGVEMQ
jgi:hypothetical protein